MGALLAWTLGLLGCRATLEHDSQELLLMMHLDQSK